MLTGEMPKQLVLFGIEPRDIVFGIGLSGEVKEGLEHLIEVVVEDLRRIGCTVEKLQQGEMSQLESIWGKI
jgi:Ni,Fe-hydrogenase maturation factor